MWYKNATWFGDSDGTGEFFERAKPIEARSSSGYDVPVRPPQAGIVLGEAQGDRSTPA